MTGGNDLGLRVARGYIHAKRSEFAATLPLTSRVLSMFLSDVSISRDVAIAYRVSIIIPNKLL